MSRLKELLKRIPRHRRRIGEEQRQMRSTRAMARLRNQRVLELLAGLPARERKTVIDILKLMHQRPEVGESLEVLRKAVHGRKGQQPIDHVLAESFQHAALEKQKQPDPLAAARARGARMRTELLHVHGGTMSSEEVGQLLNLTRQAVEARRRAGKLLAYPLEGPRYRYPRWQFSADGQVLPGLERVLVALKSMSVWGKGSFMTSGDVRLGGDTPLDRLRRGDVENVVCAANAYGEQLAT
jgi:hypothetical protein